MWAHQFDRAPTDLHRVGRTRDDSRDASGDGLGVRLDRLDVVAVEEDVAPADRWCRHHRQPAEEILDRGVHRAFERRQGQAAAGCVHRPAHLVGRELGHANLRRVVDEAQIPKPGVAFGGLGLLDAMRRADDG